ncbi:MAG: hypothetical protein K2J02_01805 [Malacoplasma sp.]|nr:hypothetical protein [Malacoplasma sp.]
MNLKSLKSKIVERKTKSWIKSISVIVFILVFFIFWLLFCDPNLLKLDWFSQPNESATGIEKTGWINLNVVWILLGLIGFTFIFFIVIKFIFKKANYDLIPFLLMPITMGIFLLISGFIPFNENNRGWIIFARLICVILSSFAVFFLSIKIINLILLKSKDASFIYEDIKKEYEEMNKMKTEDKFFSGKRKKEKDYIEI